MAAPIRKRLTINLKELYHFVLILSVYTKENKMQNNSTYESILNKMERKTAIESEIEQMKQILDSNHINMQESLVDSDGYPRQDIDVYQVRHARHKIICLMNDHKAVMKEIEQGMFSVFSQMDTGSSTSNIDRTHTHTEPIARVSTVHPNSPAEKAGIITDDLIIEFGSVNASNFKTLQDIGTVTHYSVGKSVKLFINRENRFITLSLTPSPWSGQGLLGCNILPIERVER